MHSLVLLLRGRIDHVNVRPSDQIEEEIPLDIIILFSPDPPQDEVHLESEGIAGGRQLSAVIGLHSGAADHRVSPFGRDLSQQKIEHAGLIAPEGQTGLIIPFHVYPWTTEGLCKPRHFMKRCGEEGEFCAWQPIDSASQILNSHGDLHVISP
jgi:hypothetical protein